MRPASCLFSLWLILLCPFLSASLQGQKPVSEEKVESKAAAERAFDAVISQDRALEQPILITAAKGTGQTTGHIATITVENRTDQTIRPQDLHFFIPSHSGYQSYVGRIPDHTSVPPGESEIDIPGYCTDVEQPPVPNGEGIPNVEDWVPVGSGPGISPFPKPVVPGFTPNSIPGITSDPDFDPEPAPSPGGLIPTWPGSITPIGGTLSPNTNPETVGPLLIEVVSTIEETAIDLISDGNIQTPYSGNPDREKEAVTQQTIWLTTALIFGTPYSKEDFTDRVQQQYSDRRSIPIDEITEEEEAGLQPGIDQFWDAFQATGTEAKVVRSENEPPVTTPVSEPPPEEIDTANCGYDSDFTFDPELDYDHKIADSWGDESERNEILENSENSISAGYSTDLDEVYEEYDIARNPTSTVAFWRTNHVGGFASAHARTRFSRQDGSTEWVWSTERLESSAEGNHHFWMQMTPDRDCSSMVVGSSISRIHARGRVFDAVAGNDENSLPVLRGMTWLGKKAIQFLIERKVGKTKSGFMDYIKEQATEEVKDALKEELEAQAELIFDQLMEELGIEITGEDMEIPDLAPPTLEEALENMLGIDIPSIEEGLDAAFNLFFWSNTYARAFGAMNISVGSAEGTVQAETRNLYLRQGLEDSDDAVIGMNDQCDELILTDAHPTRLDINVWGLSNMESRAEGNGHAKAELYSMNFELLVGICICPDKAPQIVEAEVYGWYQPKEGPYGNINQSSLEAFKEEALSNLHQKINTGELTADSSTENWKNAMDQFAQDWSSNAAFICQPEE